MNYMVFDLEFNQKFNFDQQNTKKIDSECPFEIIDIGAIKLDQNLKTIDTFDQLVKPQIYKRLHPFVKKITRIAKKDLKEARIFSDIYKDFAQFIKDVDVLCVWGTADIKELIRNIEYYGLDTSIVPKQYINIQQHASRYLNSPGNSCVSLGNAAKLMDIPIESELHKAFNDAYYTAEVFKKINSDSIEVKTYDYKGDIKQKDNEIKKTVLDTKKLIKQFEKMYHRKMTTEEQGIIKLAYKMGKTKQFERQD